LQRFRGDGSHSRLIRSQSRGTSFLDEVAKPFQIIVHLLHAFHSRGNILSAVGIQNLANLLQRKFPRLQSFDQSDPAAIFFPVMPVPMTAPGLLRKKEPLASIIIDRSGAQLYPPGEFTNRVTSLIHVSFVF